MLVPLKRGILHLLDNSCYQTIASDQDLSKGDNRKILYKNWDNACTDLKLRQKRKSKLKAAN
jgi:hypothetical protein